MGATAGCHEVTYNRDNKITVSNSSTAPCFWKTTETTGTTRRTDATAGCHEVTYNWDNKITVGSLFFRKLKGSAAGVMKLSDAVGLFSKDFFDAVGEMRLFIF